MAGPLNARAFVLAFFVLGLVLESAPALGADEGRAVTDLSIIRLARDGDLVVQATSTDPDCVVDRKIYKDGGTEISGLRRKTGIGRIRNEYWRGGDGSPRANKLVLNPTDACAGATARIEHNEIATTLELVYLEATEDRGAGIGGFLRSEEPRCVRRVLIFVTPLDGGAVGAFGVTDRDGYFEDRWGSGGPPPERYQARVDAIDLKVLDPEFDQKGNIKVSPCIGTTSQILTVNER
ncbi:MAG: hypothetical protein QOI31_2175 [Solirubrobacterales bacterium]|jgi:hypothetical protein|nr:hypothetical protein [Solirubrobacterales bacterium]